MPPAVTIRGTGAVALVTEVLPLVGYGANSRRLFYRVIRPPLSCCQGGSAPHERFACYTFSPMKTLRLLLNLALLAGLSAARIACAQAASQPAESQLATPEEKHLRNVRQLTFGGSNAEAYFSADGKRLIFQSTRDN